MFPFTIDRLRAAKGATPSPATWRPESASPGPALLRDGQPAEQDTQRDLQRIGEDQHHEEARLAFAALHNADLIPVQGGDFREPFLRETPALTQATHVLPERVQHPGALDGVGRHGSDDLADDLHQTPRGTGSEHVPVGGLVHETIGA